MKAKKNNLDERQEQILLKIEHRACWLAYALLLRVTASKVFSVFYENC